MEIQKNITALTHDHPDCWQTHTVSLFPDSLTHIYFLNNVYCLPEADKFKSCIFIINNMSSRSSWVLYRQSVLAFCTCWLCIHIFYKSFWKIPGKLCLFIKHTNYCSCYSFYNAIWQGFTCIVFLLYLILLE